MDFSLLSLGISAAGPQRGRWPSGHVLTAGKQGFLIDCGEGIQIALQRQGIGWSSIQTILISHLHGDHVYGLPGLLTSWALLQRDQPLRIVSPPGLREMLTAVFEYSHTGLPFEVEWVIIDPAQASQLIIEDRHLRIYSIPLDHRIPAIGYLVCEQERLRTMRTAAIEQYQIPYQQIPAIKAGGDFTTPGGELIPNELLTDDPPRSRSFAYCCDTRFKPALSEQLRDVDLLLHEATFLHELKEQAEISGHSTAREAAELAQLAEAGQLVLTHFSPRYDDLTPLLEEAQAVFSNTLLAKEGRVFDVPYEGRIEG